MLEILQMELIVAILIKRRLLGYCKLFILATFSTVYLILDITT